MTPRLSRHFLLACLFAGALPSVLLLSLAVPSPAAAQQFDTAGEATILARINEMRRSQNLSALARNASLDAAARAHCSDMAQQQQLTHVSPSSGTPADRVRAAGMQASTVAENVALHRTSEEAHAALVASDAHRGNMLSDRATHVGIASLRTAQGVYVTQVFAAIAGEPAPTTRPPSSSAVTVVPVPSDEPEELDEGEDEGDIEGAQHFEIQQGSNGTVVLQRAAPDAPINAYWVFGSGRWWFYPMPEGAQPGQRLEADRSVEQPPPGFPVQMGGAPPSSGARATRIAPQQGPAPRRPMVLDPFAGQTTVPSEPFYSTPPPPLTGAPTHAYRRAYRAWERQYRRWLRQQGAL